MKVFFLFIFGIAFLLLTNQHLSWDEGIARLQANDIKASYEKISKAAPGFPLENIARHHAQRFFWPWIVGTLSKFFAVDLEIVYHVFLVFFYAFLIVVFRDFLIRENRQSGELWFFCALLSLNPYFFRYYWIVPGMLPDVAFMAMAVAAAYFALVRRHFLFVLCFAIALLSRQTALFLLPGFIYLFFIRESSRWRVLGKSFLLGAGFLLVYGFINLFARKFSIGDRNLEIFLSLYFYLSSSEASLMAIGELVFRVILPISTSLFIALGVLRGKRKLRLNSEQIFLLVLALGILSQPILGGPQVTGKNASRLAVYALPFFVILLAKFQFRLCVSIYWRAAVGAILVLGSFHHLYSRPALPSLKTYLFVQVGCGICLWLLFRFARHQRGEIVD